MAEKLSRRTQLVALAVAALLAVAAVVALPATAHAATKSMSSGTYTTFYNKSDKGKIVVKNEGVVTLTARMTSTWGSATLSLYNTSGDEVAYLDSGIHVNSTTAKSMKVAVSPGTYYVKFSYLYTGSGNYTGYPQVKYSFSKITQGTNYTKSKALTLKKNTTKYAYNTQNYTFDRWYKITLTSAQYVTLYRGGYGVSVELYDSKGKGVSLASAGSGAVKTQNVLAKGTYYIKLDVYRSNINETTINSIKWK